MHTELFLRHENIIAIRTCVNWFKKQWFRYQWQRTLWTSCNCERGRIAKRWEKVVENDGKYYD